MIERMEGADRTRTGGPAASIDLTDPAPSRRVLGPLGDLRPAALRRLARRGDRLRRRDMARFQQVAVRTGITSRQLRLLADGWDEGGRSGVAALGPATPADPELMRRAEQVVETWRRNHFPLDALRTETWRNRLTVWWLRPSARPTDDLHEHPLMQLRRSDDGRWHLYRRAVQGEWWPVRVRGRRRRQPLSACLDAVRVDPLQHFWGSHGPPEDLAVGDAETGWQLP